MPSFASCLALLLVLVNPAAALHFGAQKDDRVGVEFSSDGALAELRKQGLGSRASSKQASGLQAKTPKIVYGTMFGASSTKDLKLLQTQWNTFLRIPHLQNRTFATTDDTFSHVDPNIIHVNTGQCFQPNPSQHAYCAMDRRRTDLFVEAAKRDADWLVLHHTDMMWTRQFEEYLTQNFDPTEPQVVGGSIGCGLNETRFKDECPKMFEQGGLCGGNHYVFSRAAIANLLRHGPEGLASEYATLAAKPSPPPEDIADGCVVRRHNIKVTHMNGKTISSEKFELGTVSKLSDSMKNFMSQEPDITQLDSSSFTLGALEHFLIFHPVKDPEMMAQIYPRCVLAGMCAGQEMPKPEA